MLDTQWQGPKRRAQGQREMAEERPSALSSLRPYLAAFGMGTALAEIDSGAGRQFDAAVVAACVEALRDKGMRLPE
jgi:hypothetical protein